MRKDGEKYIFNIYDEMEGMPYKSIAITFLKIQGYEVESGGSTIIYERKYIFSEYKTPEQIECELKININKARKIAEYTQKVDIGEC